jgi:hypothetical protein
MKEIISALLISIFNFSSGVLVYKFIINKENKLFYRIFLISVLLRYVINLFFLWICLKLLVFEPLTFGLSYLLGVFLAIILEVLLLSNKIKFLNLQFNKKMKFEKHKNGK